jgi:hypothetical protein
VSDTDVTLLAWLSCGFSCWQSLSEICNQFSVGACVLAGRALPAVEPLASCNRVYTTPCCDLLHLHASQIARSFSRRGIRQRWMTIYNCSYV